MAKLNPGDKAPAFELRDCLMHDRQIKISTVLWPTKNDVTATATNGDVSATHVWKELLASRAVIGTLGPGCGGCWLDGVASQPIAGKRTGSSRAVCDPKRATSALVGACNKKKVESSKHEFVHSLRHDHAKQKQLHRCAGNSSAACM